LQTFDICVYVEPSAAASAAALAADSAALAAVRAAITAVTAAATAAVSVTTMITVSTAAIAAALWLIVVCCPRRCLCFCLPPPLPAPAVAAVVCWRHCHCSHRRNLCSCSFHAAISVAATIVISVEGTQKLTNDGPSKVTLTDVKGRPKLLEQAPIKLVDGRPWSPGVYPALRLMGSTLEVAWEKAFVRTSHLKYLIFIY
jgi:hypothetical protein